jgi:hypothetical protein
VVQRFFAFLKPSGEAMLGVADAIWAELVRLSAEHKRQIDAMDAAAKAGTPPPGTQWLDGMPVFTQPRAKMIPFMGCSDAYLMNAGYAVENLLKAVRVKRLSIAGTRAAYANGPKDRSPDRIPVNHEYLDFAREELGTLSDQEGDLLQRLTLFVRWACRYHIGREPRSVVQLNLRRREADDLAVRGESQC